MIARIDGELVGCGSLQPAEGVAWLGGAATRPEYRRRGVQSALLAHRIGGPGDGMRPSRRDRAVR